MTTVTPNVDSRLAQLTAQYDLAKAELQKAEESLKAITDGIKQELSALLQPGQTSIDLVSSDLVRPLRLSCTTSWRVDAKRLKKDAPETYVRYATKADTWRLAPISNPEAQS